MPEADRPDSNRRLDNFRIVAEGLQFPEGPVALADGSIAFTEIRARRVSRLTPDGRVEVIAVTGGGPNGLAAGPGGALFVCNNGGSQYAEGQILPTGPAVGWAGGCVQRIEPSGKVETLYTHCGDRRLSSPNDLVFDAHGGFYFSDFGKIQAAGRDHGAIYYALPDGSRISEIAFPLLSPNGIALSPDGSVLYFADTETARIYAFDLAGPGVVRKHAQGHKGARMVCGLEQVAFFDSLALDSEGRIYIGTLVGGCITVIDPIARRVIAQIKVSDTLPTNLCFGGTDRRKVYMTLAETGKLAVMDSVTPGLALNY